MNRHDLFEIGDQRFCPTVFRDYLTDLLQRVYAVSDLFGAAVPLLERTLAAASTRQVVDLCSGAGGPWPGLLERLPGVSVTLTDRHPNLGAGTRLASSTAGRIRVWEQPVLASSVPPELTGVRTMFAGFHHLSPPTARAVLKDAAQRRHAIAIFEFTECAPARVLIDALMIPLLTWYLTASVRPLPLARLFWTYCVPVVPLLFTWDGVVSHLKSYTPRELGAMTRELASPGYRWDVGQIASDASIRLTYVLGYPEA